MTAQRIHMVRRVLICSEPSTASSPTRPMSSLSQKLKKTLFQSLTGVTRRERLRFHSAVAQAQLAELSHRRVMPIRPVSRLICAISTRSSKLMRLHEPLGFRLACMGQRLKTSYGRMAIRSGTTRSRSSSQAWAVGLRLDQVAILRRCTRILMTLWSRYEL